MKKIFLLILVIFSLQSNAQEFKLILLNGLNASQINGDDLAGFDQLGYTGGLGISRKISAKTGLQFEIAYSQKGSRDQATKGNLIQDSVFRVNYIDIPLLFNYYYKDKFIFQGGLYAGVLLNAYFNDHINKTDKTNDYALVDYGFGGGAEYRFYEGLSVNLRVTQSIISTNKIEEYYNLVSSLTLRYTFQ